MQQGTPSTPAGQGAWISDVFINTNNSRSFRHIPDGPCDKMELLRKGADLLKRMQRGEPFAAGEIERDRHHSNNWPFEETLPPVILFGWVALHRDVAAVFSRFDPGQGRLHPIRLIDNDRRKVISEDYSILTPGNAADTLDLDRSTSVKRQQFLDKQFYIHETVPKPGTFVLRPGFGMGPDFWVDSRVFNAFFLSDRLVAALAAEKLDRHFGLRRCVPG